MPRVVTNDTTLSYAEEASLGVLPGSPEWFELQPNSIRAFGITPATEQRTPIGQARARRKGIVTDLDSAVEFEADLTLFHLRQFIEAFLFSQAVGADSFITSAATATGYTVPALSAGAAGRLTYGGAAAKSLVYVRGFADDANNGLKPVTAAHAGGATEIKAAGNVAEVPAATTLVEVSVAGVRGAAGDIEVDANGDIISTVLDFTTLGLVAGQVIHVGGIDVIHQFFNEENLGFVRLRTIAAHKLTIDKRDQDFVVDDGTDTGGGGAALAIDLLFGQFVRTVPMDHADYLEKSLQFELASPNLMTGPVDGYEYAIGNLANAMSISIPLTGKATVTFGFMGTNTTDPSSVRATNAATAKGGGQEAAFGSASDIARLRVQDVDETGISTDFKSATFTLTNNVTAEKVIGNLGPKYLNVGMFEADIQNQMLFTNPEVIERIRCNETVGFDWALHNADGGAVFDLPAGTLTGGGREYPANATVLVNDTFAAYLDDAFGYTVGVSFFPVLPAQPC